MPILVFVGDTSGSLYPSHHVTSVPFLRHLARVMSWSWQLRHFLCTAGELELEVKRGRSNKDYSLNDLGSSMSIYNAYQIIKLIHIIMMAYENMMSLRYTILYWQCHNSNKPYNTARFALSEVGDAAKCWDLGVLRITRFVGMFGNSASRLQVLNEKNVQIMCDSPYLDLWTSGSEKNEDQQRIFMKFLRRESCDSKNCLCFFTSCDCQTLKEALRFIIKLFETYNGTQSLYFLLEPALGGLEQG